MSYAVRVSAPWEMRSSTSSSSPSEQAKRRGVVLLLSPSFGSRRLKQEPNHSMEPVLLASRMAEFPLALTTIAHFFASVLFLFLFYILLKNNNVNKIKIDQI